ncbi:hypothetical protein [Roseateles puraquae]|jgi:hypothetical protein|uniref:hypothetical protein n=1 Tax=Roseateles puraquae TaxID=431059 RepID=UPI0031D2C7E8
MLIGLVGVVSLIWPIMIQSAVAARSGFLSSPGTTGMRNASLSSVFDPMPTASGAWMTFA